MDIQTLKEEHRALLELRSQMLALIDDADRPSTQIASLRWRFSRVLLAHLAREDKHLYPLLGAASDPKLAALATRYEREMGNIAHLWQAFITDWPSDRMSREWSAFKQAARFILDALHTRILFEERDLYPRYAALVSSAATLPRAG
ncbi:MAG: hemerythrin domain-containing protein [Sphingomonas sp.]|nr:hemerythrin domain-containing protein [Sphingomonas sp.]